MSIQTLVEKIKEKGNPTVAGLDARLEYIPQHISRRNMMLHGETLRAAAESVVAFNCGLIDALCDIVPAVKPQAAYYELLGSYGAMALKETIDYAHAKGMYVIGDIKRNDIGATATAYAEAYLGKTRVGDTEIAPYGCDSVTVNGYLGTDGVEPFLKECRERDKSLFVLVKTSNPSSGELQNRDMEGKPLYARMAEMVAKWGEGLDTPCGYNQVGAVVGATATAYAEAYLGKTRVGDTEIAPYGCDSVTVNGYLGTDGIEPFLKECRARDRSLFVLVKTSNPSSGELQNRDMGGKPLYARMAEMVAKWGEGLDTPCGYNQIGAVVGATYPEEQKVVRELLPKSYFLVPGYGAQGATAKDIANAFNDDGLGAIVNSSRGIMCAWKKTGKDGEDYKEAARAEAIRMRDDIVAAIK